MAHNKILPRIFLFLIILPPLLIIGGWIHLESKWKESLEFSSPVQIEIKRGMSTPHVQMQLAKLGVPIEEFYYRTYFKLKGNAKKINQGRFQILPGMSLLQIDSIITTTPGIQPKVTVPEGRASWEIFAIYKNKFPHLDTKKWEKLTQSKAWAEKLGLKSPNLEGYLFPDTYEFTPNVSEQEILIEMVNKYLDVWSKLDKSNSSVFKKVGQNGVTTLASVVEEETSKGNERKRIAGVFWNRYKMGMPLGADPTVRFVFRNLTGPIYRSQLNFDSPYNTRKNRGLPPGPISNPGKKALIAALNPNNTPYLYFVAKDDGSREHFFTTNLADHNKYKDIAARNRAK